MAVYISLKINGIEFAIQKQNAILQFVEDFSYLTIGSPELGMIVNITDSAQIAIKEGTLNQNWNYFNSVREAVQFLQSLKYMEFKWIGNLPK